MMILPQIRIYKMTKIAIKLSRSVDFYVHHTLVVLIVCVIGWLMIYHGAHAVAISDSLRKEMTLTQNEKIAFDKFKSAVYKNLILDYIKQDLFLLRWIRGKDLDVERAVRDMFMYLEFIEKNKLATILDEDWNDLLEDFPFATNITDRQGRPVGYGSVGGSNKWNIRRAVLQGKRPRLIRYTYMMFFQINQKLWDIQRKQPNVTQFSVLMNLDGFNPVNQICTLCISTYINLLGLYERFLPGFVHEILVINAPQAYLGLVDSLRPFLSKHTREALKLFGPNRRKWLPYLDSKIDIKKLPDSFF